ncbi:MAG: hypothetical protein ABS948_05140 [Solibacillus sp.]
MEKNLIGLTELRRGNRVSELLDAYASHSREIVVVQSTKHSGKAVIVNLEYFNELVASKELCDLILKDKCIEKNPDSTISLKYSDPTKREFEELMTKIQSEKLQPNKLKVDVRDEIVTHRSQRKVSEEELDFSEELI